jgi:hypothetical protein
VIINDNLTEGSIVSVERVGARPPTKTLTPTTTVSVSAVSISDITSLKSENDDFGHSYNSSSPVQRSAVRSTSRNGSFGTDLNKLRRALPAASTASAKDIVKANSPAVRPSAQGTEMHPLPRRGNPLGEVDRRTGLQMAVTDDGYEPRPQLGGRGKEAEGAHLQTWNSQHSYDVDSSRQPSLSRRAAMPPDKSGRSAQEGGGRGWKGASSGHRY